MVHFNLNEVLADGPTTINCMKIADDMMASIMYDSGMVVSGIGILEKHPIKHVRTIGIAVKIFITSNEDTVFTEYDFEEMATGEYGEIIENYSRFNGFNTLQQALNNWFNDYEDPEEEENLLDINKFDEDQLF